MKKKLWKVVSALLAVIIIITSTFTAGLSIYAATPVSLEGSTFDVWADPYNVLNQEKINAFSSDKLSTLGGVKPFKLTTVSTGIYYLFLPSNADCTNLTFWFKGTTMKIDSTTITSGVPTDVLKDIDNSGTVKEHSIDGHRVVCMKSGNVGTVFVDTVSGSMKTVYGDSDHKANEAGSIMVVQPDGRTVDYMGAMDKIQGRGNATWGTGNEKNPFNIKLAESTSLLGMNKAKKWVLLANASDSSLLRDQITYDFAKYVGVKYQPTCKPVDLYINQQYYGSYQLSEKVEIKSNRIDISDAYENLEIANGTFDEATGVVIPKDLNGTSVVSIGGTSGFGVGQKRYSSSLQSPSDYTGGYLYELEISDRWVDENAGFCGYNRQCWVLKNCDYASQSMLDYSYDLLYALGSSVYNGGVVPSEQKTFNYFVASTTNPAPAAKYQGKKWSEMLDSDSAVRYYWVEELFKNLDASTTSCYFYKDSDAVDSKLYAGPVWDMDKCWGSAGDISRWGHSLTSTDDWYAKNVRIYKFYKGSGIQALNYALSTDSTDNQRPLAFLGQLATQQDFWADVQRYWYAYISNGVDVLMGRDVDETGTLKSIDEYANTIQYTGKMNEMRFSATNSTYNNISFDYSGKASTLKNWISGRQTFINGEFTPTDISKASVAPIFAQTYTGEEIKPEINITGTVDGVSVELEKGIDYNIEYSNNINAGTATIKITGLGMFSGTKSVAFTINPIHIEDGYNATIDPYSYMDSPLTVKIANENGKTISGNVTYQWYKNGTLIDGANDKTYIVDANDVGAKIYAVVTGDESNVTGTLTSNECIIKAGQRPTGFTKTIASWSYDFTNDSEALKNADETGETRYYLATAGENQSTSTLKASVNAVDDAKIKWSGTADLYVNGEVTDQAPVIGTSKTDMLGWGKYPYFETTISTAGYENIGFSAKLGGTKKGPRDWKLQYSLDGTEYVDIDGATYSIVDNKTLEQAFFDVQLPVECTNQDKLYIRITACSNVAINGVNAIVGQTSGDAAINDIIVTGSSTGVVTSLNAPVFDVADGSTIFDDTLITTSDTNGGADLYCYVNGGEPQQYNGSIKVFDSTTSKAGDRATVSAYAKFDDIVSEVTTVEYVFGGVDLSNFSYDSYSTDVTNGGVQSVKGVYGKSGIMTAYADGKSQYVPLWRDDKGSYCVSPDDGLLWSEQSGFTYAVSTAGYENITFTADAYTTSQGPNSIVLQYSLNGITYTDITDNVKLAANGELENLFTTLKLPSECDNKQVVYIRIATKENLTNIGTTLHKAESKGNLYVNNVIVAGEQNGDYKMPYTNKSTDFFGINGTIKYYSPDRMPIKYAVRDSSGKVVLSGTVPETGILLSEATGFSAKECEPYTVLTWVQEDENISLINQRTYYCKGSTITKFDFTSTKRPLSSHLSDDGLVASNTGGANAATLYMMPNGVDKAELSYTDAYGVKIAWSELNPFYATKKLDNPENNGCWVIEANTKGYTNVSLSLNQISSNKGPRDWGVAYSFDGVNYTYVENSNVRAISNDATIEPVQTYSNLLLPSACDDKEKVYIKIFINGGESVEGQELELMTKGNTGINSIELSGIEIPSYYNLTVKTVVKDTPEATEGTVATDAVVVINDKVYNTENGEVAVSLLEGKNYSIYASLNGETFVEGTTVVLNEDTQVVMPIVAVDYVADGLFNAKDYAKFNREVKNDTLRNHLKQIFENFYTAE